MARRLRATGLARGRIGLVGVNATFVMGMPYQHHAALRESLPDAVLVEVTRGFASLRTVKSGEELTWLRRASAFTDRTIEALRAEVRPGLPEYALLGIVEGGVSVRGRAAAYRVRAVDADGRAERMPAVAEPLGPHDPRSDRWPMPTVVSSADTGIGRRGLAEERLPRRLAAIVVGDVAGYSRMMQADEALTLAALRAMMNDVVDPSTEEFRGRIVKVLGDGWLAEFRSVSDALLSSLEIQRSMARRKASTVPEGRLELRIGINLGEIVFEGEDIFGTGVNIASRLQSIAKPGASASRSPSTSRSRGSSTSGTRTWACST